MGASTSSSPGSLPISRGQPRILFLTLSDDIGSERIVCEMSRRGAICAVLGRPGTIAARAMRVAHHHDLPSRGGAWMAARAVPGRLERIAADWTPDAVVPLDDMATQLLRDLALRAGTGLGVRALIEASLGSPSHYRVVGSRALVIETAAALGLRTPRQRRIGSLAAALAAADDLGYPVMLKRDGTCGGGGVARASDRRALVRAFRTADRRAQVKRAMQALIGLHPGPGGSPLTLQAHVPGLLVMRSVACDAGRVLSGITFAAERVDPPVTGASTVVCPVDHTEMTESAARLVAALGCSGFVSFDFILSADGAAHLIEMNPRPIGSGHLGARFGHDLYGTWLKRFPGFRDADAPAIAGDVPRAVALFPKEVSRDPASPHLAAPDILHDVPWDEPRVVARYLDRLVERHPAEAAVIARRLGAPLDEGVTRRQVRSGLVRLRGFWT